MFLNDVKSYLIIRWYEYSKCIAEDDLDDCSKWLLGDELEMTGWKMGLWTSYQSKEYQINSEEHINTAANAKKQ